MRCDSDLALRRHMGLWLWLGESRDRRCAGSPSDVLTLLVPQNDLLAGPVRHLFNFCHTACAGWPCARRGWFAQRKQSDSSICRAPRAYHEGALRDLALRHSSAAAAARLRARAELPNPALPRMPLFLPFYVVCEGPRDIQVFRSRDEGGKAIIVAAEPCQTIRRPPFSTSSWRKAAVLGT